MRNRLLALLLAVIALAPVGLLTYYYSGKRADSPEREIASIKFEPETKPTKLVPGARFDVKACKVLDGYRYEMYLDGGTWIEAHLAAAAKEEAAQVVVELLNKAAPPTPTVTLLRQVGDRWIVDFELTVDGQRTNMVRVLKVKGLLF
jgi:hypothetical protein